MTTRLTLTRQIMKLNLLLFLSILTKFSSCYGQNTSQVDKSTSTYQNSIQIRTIGDTVSETHDSVLVVFQARNNIYWFGSNGHGAYRYDGKSLLHFTTKDGLCHNKIVQIQEDKSGNIYFNTDGGISKFDGQNFATLNITSNSNDGWKSEPDDLWFKGAQDSGVVYRYDGQSLHRLTFPKTKPAEEHILNFPWSKFPAMAYNPYDVYSIYTDSKGNVWFGTGMLGVCRFDGKSFGWIPNSELGLDKIAFCVRAIIEDEDGKFWFSNSRYRYTIYQNESPDSYPSAAKGLSTARQDGQGINFRKEKGIDPSNDQKEDDYTYIMSIAEGNDGDLWMATFGAGVWRYDLLTQNLTHYPVKDGNTTVTLFSIYKDHQDVLWLGTHVAGAYKFNGNSFEKFRP